MIVIKHWRMHNTLRKDRYNPTQYQEELSTLAIKENSAYTEAYGNQLATNWQPDGNHLEPQYSIEKYSVVEGSIEECSSESRKRETSLTLLERLAPDYIFEFPNHAELLTKVEEWIKYKTERKESYKEQGMKALLRQIENNALTYGDKAVMDLIDESMANGWRGIIFDRLKEKQATSDRNKQQNKRSNGIDFREMWDNERGQGR